MSRRTLAVAEPSAAETLCRLTTDPERVQGLHGLLGEFCHLIRNRLNSLQIGVYLARTDAPNRGGDPARWDELDAHYRSAERIVEMFQAVCRPMPLQPIRIGLDLVIADFCNRWAPRFAERSIDWTVGPVEVAEPSRLDPTRLAQGLDAMASWRLDEAAPGTRIRFDGMSQRGWSRIEWAEEDGDGGCDCRGVQDGGLSLAVLARVASAHGGRLTTGDRGGWRMAIDWPNAIADA
jgi:hypothetical protein